MADEEAAIGDLAGNLTVTEYRQGDHPDPNKAIANLTSVLGKIATITEASLSRELSAQEKTGCVQTLKECRDTIVNCSMQISDAKRNRNENAHAPNVTIIPDFSAGTKDNCQSDCKNFNKLPIWTGTPPDFNKCKWWLDKMFSAAKSSNLSEKAARDLLFAKSDGPLFTNIQQAILRNKTTEELVRGIEILFGKVVDPQEAEIRVEKMLPYEGETIGIFGQRVWNESEQAKRTIKDETERFKATEDLAIAKILKVLETWQLNYVKNEQKRELQDGKPKWDFPTLLERIQDFINSNDVRRAREREEKKQKLLTLKDNENSKIRMVTSQILKIMDSDDSDSGCQKQKRDSSPDSEIESSDENEDAIEKIDQVMDLLKKRRDKAKFQKKYDKKPLRKRDKIGRVDAMEVERKQGTPLPLRVSKPDFPSDKMQELAGVQKGVCYKCGLKNPPHLANDPACPLWSQEYTDRPCYACGQGLHTWQKCPLAKTSGFINPADKKRKN